ncbi:MAG: hypothetical protein WA908_10660 [Pontixanthobacter sp.]
MNYRIIITAIAALFFSASASAETWYRADTHHFVVYSNGSEKKTAEFAQDTEKFDALLRKLFGREPEVDPNRLTIYLIDNAREVDRLIGGRSGTTAGFYVARPEGSFAVANRERGGRWDLDGQTVLFHEYAHHFMFRNMAVPAPAWFVEGFAEFMATAEFNKDGSWSYGRVAGHRAYSLLRGPKIPIRDLLTQRPTDSVDNVFAFYGRAWALTHMLYRSETRGERIGLYLAELQEGVDPIEAAETVFGDLDDFEDQLQDYIEGSINYTKFEEPLPYLDAVTVNRLSDYQSELVELTLQRTTGYKTDRTRKKLMRLTQHPDADAEVWYQLAKLEHVAAHDEDAPARYDFTSARTAVEGALALKPDHLLANVLMGDLVLEPFDHDLEFDPQEWSTARRYYGMANKADPLNPLPLFRFGQSFLKEGRKNEQVGMALEQAFLGAPESQEIRLTLANHHAEEKEFDEAISLLKIIAGNPHSGEGARALIASLEEAKSGADAPIDALKAAAAEAGDKTGADPGEDISDGIIDDDDGDTLDSETEAVDTAANP